MENNATKIANLVLQEVHEARTKHGKSLEYDIKNNAKWELKDAAVALQTSKGKFPPNWDMELCKKMNRKDYKQRLIYSMGFLLMEYQRVEATEGIKEPATDKEY